MAFPVELDEQEYGALVTLARRGVENDQNKRRELESFLRNIEANNDITRDAVWVQWQEADQPLPPNTDFPEVWPPELRFYFELVTRPIARADVDQVLEAKARQPVNVLLTRDPEGLIGWTEIDQFFVN